MKQQGQSFFEKNMVLIKVSTVLFLTLILLIPIAMIQSLVMERRGRLAEATADISSMWGGEQRVAGPILSVPYYTYELNKSDEKVIARKRFAYFLPDELNISGTVLPEIRYRGIFQVAVYASKLKLEGTFSSLSIQGLEPNAKVDWAGAFLTVGLSDMRGIKDSIPFNWNGQPMDCKPGVAIPKVLKSGITVNNILSENPAGEKFSFTTEISLNGSNGLSFIPVGKETLVNISSEWSNPSFEGAFLPESREVTNNGFDASWRVLELNRNYPQQWHQQDVSIDDSAFGVRLLLPVENYQITERSMKYAMLFVGLTFMVFFFVEVLRNHKLHPIHYMLVGFGLVLFYLLLLSLSEHIGFGIAYAVASVAIISLITSYSQSIFKDKKLTMLMGGFLIVLYSLLYILLQMQDYALLLGSLVLFVVLALAMYLSRNVDWYAIGKKNGEGI